MMLQGAQETTMKISEDMDKKIGQGGFLFKEMVMTGDLLGESGKLRKVLGLQGDTTRYELSVNVQENFGEKRRGGCPPLLMCT
jgi:hypothetical protein